MMRNIKDVVISAGFVFVIGFVLWPPRGNYWAMLYDALGGQTGEPTRFVGVVIVLILSVIFGLVFKNITNFSLSNFVLGGVLAYIIGMWMIGTIIDPDSPAHLILYGVILVFLIGGMAISDVVG